MRRIAKRDISPHGGVTRGLRPVCSAELSVRRQWIEDFHRARPTGMLHPEARWTDGAVGSGANTHRVRLQIASNASEIVVNCRRASISEAVSRDTLGIGTDAYLALKCLMYSEISRQTPSSRTLRMLQQYRPVKREVRRKFRSLFDGIKI